MLPMVQRIWFNRIDRPENQAITDLSPREIVVLAPLLAGMLWMGVYPKPFLERSESAAAALIEAVERQSTVPGRLSVVSPAVRAGTTADTD
jgi:NADH-quinone oxidoreductase subunit M